jgi:hypothetical protein
MQNNLENLVYLFFIILVGFAAYYYYEKTGYQLKCIVSDVDGNKYCVRERNQVKQATDLLAKTTEKCKKLIDYLKEKYPDDERVQRLVSKFNPDKINETLPTSQYTAYSQNKGEKMSFCLNKDKENNENLIDEHTLMFVSLHELSHIMTVSIGHQEVFWANFKFLLEEAKNSGIHDPTDYKKSPQKYCGMTIHDSPFYDT